MASSRWAREAGGWGTHRAGSGWVCPMSAAPGSLHCPPPGAPLLYALHLPDCPASAPARGHARRLGRQQRLHAHRCRAGQPTAPVLAYAHGPQGGGSNGVLWKLKLLRSLCRRGTALRDWVHGRGFHGAEAKVLAVSGERPRGMGGAVAFGLERSQGPPILCPPSPSSLRPPPHATPRRPTIMAR